MTEISDEMLMAYADGELDSPTRARVDAYLGTSIDGVRRLDVYMATGRGLSDLFEQPMHEPVPQRLLDTIAAPAQVLPFPRTGSARARRWTPSWPTAIAASLTLLAAGGSAFWYGNRGTSVADPAFGTALSESGARIASEGLASVLEKGVVGVVADTMLSGKPASVKPVFTFATVADGYCRQYVITTNATSALGGVACRTADGQWQVEAQEAFQPSAGATKEIAPAGGEDGLKDIEAAVDRLISGDVLSSDAEAKVMARGWTSEH